MGFKLIVRFTGLCLHVKHPDKTAVAVLMPDGRYLGDEKLYADRTPAAAHVGYIRMDLANIVAGSTQVTLPRGERPGRVAASDGPYFETICRFGDLTEGQLAAGRTLDFGLPAPAVPINHTAELPNLDLIAPNIPLRPGLFTKLGGATPAAGSTPAIRSPLLFRTLLLGGTVESAPGKIDESWSIDRRLNQPLGPPLISPFPGETVWTRDVPDQDSMTLTLTDFDGSNRMQVPLTQVNGEIRLKIANLCEENPVEWGEFFVRAGGLEDSDFKWYYELLDPPGDSANATPQGWAERWRKLLDRRLLPAPRLISQRLQLNGGPPYDCAESEKTEAFPSFDSWST